MQERDAHGIKVRVPAALRQTGNVVLREGFAGLAVLKDSQARVYDMRPRYRSYLGEYSLQSVPVTVVIALANSPPSDPPTFGERPYT